MPTARSANFTASHDGFYRVELDAPSGERRHASPQYTIDPLLGSRADRQALEAGRDTDATPVEEFFVEARADDDYAVKNLQLVYSVNGGAEDSAVRRREADQRSHRGPHLLHGGARREGRRLVRRITQGDRQRRGQRRQADEQRHLFPAHPSVRQELQAGDVDVGGGGGGGGGGQEVGALSQQRQIISGTSTSSAIARP